jgi:hypothetical protein
MSRELSTSSGSEHCDRVVSSLGTAGRPPRERGFGADTPPMTATASSGDSSNCRCPRAAAVLCPVGPRISPFDRHPGHRRRLAEAVTGSLEITDTPPNPVETGGQESTYRASPFDSRSASAGRISRAEPTFERSASPVTPRTSPDRVTRRWSGSRALVVRALRCGVSPLLDRGVARRSLASSTVRTSGAEASRATG